jgi:hypothetical protein
VSRQEEKLQKVIVGEERFLGKDPSPGITYDRRLLHLRSPHNEAILFVWIYVKEEALYWMLVGKIKRQAAGFKTLRARLHEKDEALKELGLAHDTAARQLASRYCALLSFAHSFNFQHTNEAQLSESS